MVELQPVPALSRPWRDAGHDTGCRVTSRSAAIVGIAVRRDRMATLRQAVQLRWRVELPVTPRFVQVTGAILLWSGPGRWLLVADRDAAGDAAGDAARDDAAREDELVRAFAPDAAIAAQGDGRVLLEVSGPRAREVLSRGLPIDLHPRAFAPGHTALTVAAHVDLQLWQTGATHYEVAVPRSYADSFVAWLGDAGAQYGGPPGSGNDIRPG